MIKKLFILMTIVLVSAVFVGQQVNAESVLTSEPAANAGGLWHVEDGNRVYVNMRYTDGSTVIETGNFPVGVKDYLLESDPYASNPDNYDYSTYTYWPDYRENDLSFPNSTNTKYATIVNPDPTTYTTFKIEIISNMTSEWRNTRGEPSFKEIVSYSEPVEEIVVELYDKSDLTCVYDYSYINLLVDGEKVLSTRQLDESKANYCLNQFVGPVVEGSNLPEENPNYEDLSMGVRMYWEKSTITEPIDPGITEDPWIALPTTLGNPINPVGDWGTVSNMSVAGQQVSFDVDYNGIRYPISPFNVEGDLDFISKANDILYYTDPNNDDRFLYFNFGDTLETAILTATSFDDVKEWKGEALWNLTQNEIKVTDVLRVYNYIPEVDEDGNVYSYFYMPDVPIDSLISVSSLLAYRYWSDGFLWTDPSPGDVQYKTVAAVKGETTSVNPTWVEDTYTMAYISSATATAILAKAALTGTAIPGYGWAIAGAGFLLGGALQIADVNEFFAYDVEQIQHVIPDTTLTNQVNTFIAESSDQDNFSADTDKLYKLHLATLDTNDEVEIMDELSNVTQVVWETDGEIYVVNEEYIDDNWGGPGTLIPQTSNPLDIPEELIWAGVGIAAFYVFAKMNLAKKPGLLILLLGVVAYYLYKMGLL